jgi:hypothetical protein
MNYISKLIILLQTVILAGILILALNACHSQGHNEEAVKSQTNLRRFVPTTVSDGWLNVYEKLPEQLCPSLPGSRQLWTNC